MIRLAVWLKNEDHRLLYLVNLKFKCPLLDWWMPKITHLGGAVCSIGAALLLLFLGDAGQDGLIALAASHLLVQVLKINFSRRRPYLADDNVHLSHHPLRDYSFPSGHATAVFTLATILSLTFPWFSLLLIPLSGAVGISRIYLGLHYQTDVVGGAVIGMAFAIGTHLLT